MAATGNIVQTAAGAKRARAKILQKSLTFNTIFLRGAHPGFVADGETKIMTIFHQAHDHDGADESKCNQPQL